MELRSFDTNFGLANKTVLITGEGITGLFYEKGANLVLIDLDADIARVGAEMGFAAARFAAVTGDIITASVREEAVTTGLERFEAVDILVNNAGLSRLAPTLESSKIVNLASKAGVIALEGRIAYCASKAVIINMIRISASSTTAWRRSTTPCGRTRAASRSRSSCLRSESVLRLRKLPPRLCGIVTGW